jgi:hypothetical protein
MSGGSDESREAPRYRQLLTDSRARIPFALIGVLLLVSAGLFVLHAETGTEKSVDTDPDLAMDRTETAAEAAVRDATTRATERAAAQPLTTVAGTRYSEALDERKPFRSYLRALIYLEVSERLSGAGQRVGDVRTTVAVSNVTDPDSFADAVERVSVTPGRADPSLQRGKLRVTVEDVLVEARRNGETIDRRQIDIEVTVATPLFELHERTETYQRRLNAGIDESGFGQRFNARIYALGWARGYAQYAGAPVTQVIANRHVVPAANDAVYRTQQDVFGAADPQLSNAVRRGWFCMATQDANELYGGYSGSTGDTTVPRRLCEGSKWIFGAQATGDPPDAPGVTDLLGEAPGMDAKHTVSLGETAKIPLGIMLGDGGKHSIWSAVDRIYTIETALDLAVENVEEPEFEHDPPARYTGSGSQVSLQTLDITVNVDEVTEVDDPGVFHRIDGSVTVEVEEARQFTDHGVNETYETVTKARDSLTADLHLALREAEASPNANIDTYNGVIGQHPDTLTPEYKYKRGPGRVESSQKSTVPGLTDSEGFVNYAKVGETVLEEVVETALADSRAADRRGQGRTGSIPWDSDATGGSSSDESSAGTDGGVDSTNERIERWLEAEWDEATAAGDLSLPATVKADVTGGFLTDADLKQTIVADLARIQNEVGKINVTFKRKAVMQTNDGEGPFARLYEKVERKREAYLAREQPYENVGQQAVYEARYSYFELILRELDRLDSAHGKALDALDEEVGDLGLDNALDFLQQGLAAEPPDPVPMKSSSLTPEITYEVSGSPTYLVAENVTSETVPAVRNDRTGGGEPTEFDPLAASNRNYLKLPYESVVNGILSKAAKVLGLGGDPDAELTFQMAGEALRASDLAIDAAEADEYGESGELRARHDSLEGATESAIDDFESEAAAQIAFALYPDDTTFGNYNLGADNPKDHFGPYLQCDDGVCQLESGGAQRCTSEYCVLVEDSEGRVVLDQIETAVSETVDEYGTSTSERAIAIDEGNVTRPISKAVAAAIPRDRRPSHANGIDDDEWQALVRSVAEQAIASAASEQHVTLDDTDTVEQMDTEIRRTLEKVSEDIVEQRVADRFGEAAFNLSDYDNWVDGVDTPVRVPAGMPLLPLPNLWFATVNLWEIDVEGEYARFEVTASQGGPETATATSYVREDMPVAVEIAGERRRLGRVEPIDFEGKSVLIVVVPPGGIGVGDRDDQDPERTPTWPGAGYDHLGEEALGG